MLIDKHKRIGRKCLEDPKAINFKILFMKISLNIDEYYPGTYLKILIVFDDIIKDKIINLKLEPIVTELFTRGREINVALAFITQSYLVVPKQN